MAIGIYKITNLIDGKIYIGQSSDIEKRFKRHRINHNDAKINFPLYNAMRSDGFLNFKFETIVLCGECELDDLEKFYIKKYKSNIVELGYNCTDGGKNCKFNDDFIERMSQAKLGEKNPMYRKSPTAETLKKLSESQKKVIHTKEWHAKIGAKHKGKVLSDETKEKIRQSLLGTKLSDETKQRMSEAQTGRKHTAETLAKMRKPKKLQSIYQYTMDNELVKQYNSLHEASTETNIRNSNILSTCKGRKKTAGGYKWSYKLIGE